MITIKPKINYDCEVLIVGGGPAGSALAFHLASRGTKVIVVEAAKFPRDKVCGDGVSPIALAELAKMGITGTAKFAKANSIDKVGLFIKEEKVFIDLHKPDYLPFHARIIPRMELDNWIYEAAKKAGAVYVESTKVLSYSTTANVATAQLKNGKQSYSLKAKIIVGADGSNSAIARQMNNGKPREEFQLLGLRAYYEGVNGPTDRVDIYFTDASFPGIFWMFPKGKKGANIGIAMVSQTLPQKPEHVKKLLLDHIQNNPDILARIGNGTPQGKIDGWPITFFDPKRSITDNRVLLTGEAAGLINPLSGDGIQYALLSARWAADCLSKSLEADDFSNEALLLYREKIKEEVGYDFALSNLLVQFPRNKTFSKVWMAILSIMIARSKKDREYAATIAGIFEGTYPSHKALTASFILKTLKEGGIEVGNNLEESIRKPETMVRNTMDASHTMLSILEEIGKYPKEHGKWLRNTASKTLSVAGYVLQDLVTKTTLQKRE